MHLEFETILFFCQKYTPEGILSFAPFYTQRTSTVSMNRHSGGKTWWNRVIRFFTFQASLQLVWQQRTDQSRSLDSITQYLYCLQRYTKFSCNCNNRIYVTIERPKPQHNVNSKVQMHRLHKRYFNKLGSSAMCIPIPG